MRSLVLAAALALLPAGCGKPGAPAPRPSESEAPRAAVPAPAPARGNMQSSGESAGPPPASTSPCLMQDGKPLRIAPLRAVGTEPFWGAKIEGRCVTYSHPEDQKGSRIWTRFTPRPDGGLWSGSLGGRRFELRTHARPGCSDGMSDNSYPIAVELIVAGERRSGCAEPL